MSSARPKADERLTERAKYLRPCDRRPASAPGPRNDAVPARQGYNQRAENNNAWKGGVSPAFYRALAFTYHGEQCQRCSDDAFEKLVVHHRNADRGDNRVENLEVLCKRCHQLKHECAANLPEVVVFKRRECDSCERCFQPTGPRGSRCRSCRKKLGPSPSHFNPRDCACGASFTPTGPRATRCPSCRST